MPFAQQRLVFCALLVGMTMFAIVAASAATRSQAQFVATLIPLAILEGACLLGITAWLLNGNAVPNLVAALVLLSIAIAMVPFSAPHAGSR